MRLDLRQVLGKTKEPVRELPFSASLDFSAVTRWGEHPFPNPVEVEGVATGQSGAAQVSYTARCKTAGLCARCLVPVERELALCFSHMAVDRVEQEESAASYLIAEDGRLDLEEVVLGDLLLELPEITLCSEGCRGICPKCGANRNQQLCACDEREPDPRFDALRK